MSRVAGEATWWTVSGSLGLLGGADSREEAARPGSGPSIDWGVQVEKGHLVSFRVNLNFAQAPGRLKLVNLSLCRISCHLQILAGAQPTIQVSFLV